MELAKGIAEFTYTREQVLLLRAEYQNATLPEHLFCPDYLTTHLLNHKPLFSPDKYVECMWKNERSQKSSVSRVIRSDIPEILQNGSTLSPQRRNFQGGCKESLGSVFSQASTRNLKTDNKRGSSTSTWSGFNKGFTNGYRSSNSASNDNSRNNGMGRRDSERVEPLPEWMDDGPVNNTEIMQLGGFNDQERLEQSFQKIGLPDMLTRQKQAELQEEKQLVLPASDVEFAAQFGILDVAEIESKIIKDRIEEPKASRLSRFFGATDKPQESRQTVESPPQNDLVLPAVARLLSAGSKSIGPISEAPSNPLMDFIKQTQANTPPNVHTSSFDQITSSSQIQHQPLIQHQMYHPARFADSNDTSMTQKQKKNIDLVPTAVMLQRSTVKDEVDVRAPKFSNPNSPSPIALLDPDITGSRHSTHSNTQWPAGEPNLNDSNPIPSQVVNYIPAFCKLGTHIFPLPNPIALATDGKHISEAYANGDYKTMSFIQTRYAVQMHVFNAVQNFRNDASFLVVTENDPQFGHVLKNFIEQQRQLDGSLAEKSDEELVECSNPADIPSLNDPHRHGPPEQTPLERLMNNPGGSFDADSNGFSNLNILKNLPTSAKPLTVEELERQILGNC